MRRARTAIPTGRCVSTSRLIRVPWSALGRCGILAGSRNGRRRPDHAVLAGAALPAHVVSRPCDPGCDRDMPARLSLACLRGAPPVNRCLADIVPLSHVVRLAPRRCAVSDDNSRLKRGRAEAALRRREALPQGTLRSIWTRKSACFFGADSPGGDSGLWLEHRTAGSGDDRQGNGAGDGCILVGPFIFATCKSHSRKRQRAWPPRGRSPAGGSISCVSFKRK